VSPHIRRIFEITLLDRVFALHETLEDAQQAARSRG
jgi:anti-anti-sigma regulatory factor